MPPAFSTLAGWEDAFHEILSYLRPSEYFVFDDDEEVATRFFLRRTLFSLALSCHAFFDPALDMLWYSLDNIHPLLKLLPNYQRRDSGFYYLEGEVSPTAWSRLKTYAARVRGVTFSRKAGIDVSVWRAILEQCQGAPLLPNLRKLHTIKLNAIHILALRAFASPTLHDISLEFYEDLNGDRGPNDVAPIAGTALQEFSVKAPEITILCLFPDLAISPEHLMCLSRFTQLKELYCKELRFDEGLLFMLSDLKNLTVLTISILLRDPPESTQANLQNEFHNLTCLDLGGLPTHIARFILASSMPRLSELSVWSDTHLSDGIDTALASICQHIGPHTLSHITVQLNGFTHTPPFLMGILEPFIPFAHLEEVVVRETDSLPLRDEDLARISLAWPKLRMLRFDQSPTMLENPDRVPGSIARPTLAGLVALARGCPRLAELSISELDASVLPPVASVPLTGHGPLDFCIENLVGAEGEETQLEVAVILDRLFPRLDLENGIEELRKYGGNPNPYTLESENVSKLLRVMQLGRENYPYGVWLSLTPG